jgi:hypothetical protein
MSIEPVDVKDTVETWSRVLSEEVQCWVAFKFGTVIVSKERVDDPVEYALDILQEWGPVAAGTPLGDFNVSEFETEDGWLVSYPHDAIMNYVLPDEIEDGQAHHMLVGLIGRSKRHADFEAQEVIHVEKRY